MNTRKRREKNRRNRARKTAERWHGYDTYLDNYLAERDRLTKERLAKGLIQFDASMYEEYRRYLNLFGGP